MDSTLIIALASLLSGLGAATAAVVAAYALRAQQRGQRRQHDLENMRWLMDEWNALRPERRKAAQSLLDGKPDDDSLRTLLNFLELCGYLVHQEFITPTSFGMSVGEMAVRGWWHSSQGFVDDYKRRIGGVHFWTEVAWLNDQFKAGFPDGTWLDTFLHRQASLPDPGAVAS